LELNETSGSGGNRTHVHLLKRQAPRQRRTHFRSGPEGNRTPVLLLDRETATPLARGTVLAITNHESAGGGGIEPRRQSRRFWRPSAFPDAITTCSELSSTPCGSRTRPKRLERPPTSPEVERGTAPRTQKKEAGRGSLLPPAGADAITWRAGGYPLVSSRRCALIPKPASLVCVAARYSLFATITTAVVRRSSVIACQVVMVVTGVRCVLVVFVPRASHISPRRCVR
jgi:hypothetical protein